MTRYTLFIDGRRTEATSGRRYESVDPFLGEPWASAGASFQHSSSSGEFHGTIAATTPAGSRRV